MEPLKIYDYLALSRQRMFDAMRPLDADQYAREFPIGLGTVGRTLTHILLNEWYYVHRLQQREIPPEELYPYRSMNPLPLPELEAAWMREARQTRTAITEVRDWTTPREYHFTDDHGGAMLATFSAADLFTQLAFHEVHHRAQALNMLRHLGIDAREIGFNDLMFQKRPA